MNSSYLKASLLTCLLFLFAQTVSAQQFLFVENFDGAADNPPTNADWNVRNNSSPEGYSWFLGNPTTFTALTGADSSYLAVNYSSVDSMGTISNWLLTPEMNLENGNVFRFYTRTESHDFADRLQVYLSKDGSGTDVGNTPTSVGTFSTLLLDINSTLSTTGYPAVWTAYTVTLSGVTGNATGRFGFRYFVTSGGLYGDNSNYIGIDSVTYFAPVYVGIKPVKANTVAVSVYPNPFKNELIINGTNGKAEIYDVLGNLALKTELENGKAINTSALEKGIYMVRIINEKNELVRTQKINKE